MEKQGWEESEKRRAEERRSEKRKNEKKEDAGARKGSKVAKHYVFPMICGSGGSKSRLAGGCGAWEMKNCTPLWREAHFQVKMYKTHHAPRTFGSWDVEKVHTVPARSTFRSQNVQNTRRKGLCTPCHMWAKCEGFLAFPKTMAGVGHLKRVWKDAFSVAGAVQETCSSEMLGGQARALISWEGLHFGASDLQFWEDDIVWQVQHFVWPGITFSWQAQYFRDMDWKNRKTHWYEAVSSALNFPVLKSRRIASFLMLPTSNIEEVSQNCFVFDVANFKNWGSLAE